MMIETLVRAAHILQSQPGFTMPLVRLHAQLVQELGPEAVGSYGQIYQQLRSRAQSFLLYDTPRYLGTDGWPGTIREAYDHALNDAGYGSCVRVTLTETPSPETAGLIEALQLSMSTLIAGRRDGELHEFVERGAQQINEIARALTSAAAGRPTTLPRDPPPAT